MKNNKTTFLFPLLFGFLPTLLHTQTTHFQPDAPASRILERLEVLTDLPCAMHPELHLPTRRDAVEFARALDISAAPLSQRDREDIQYLYDESNEWAEREAQRNERGLLRYFYKTPANFFEVKQPFFSLKVNPMLNVNLSKSAEDDKLLFQNQRGVEVRGEVDGRVFFYTNFLESQARFPNYVTAWVEKNKAIPGNGHFKNYRSRLLDDLDGYDFNNANAYLGFHATRHVSLQFGHGRHFVGSGFRSLLLSDFGNAALYLKLTTRVWRFQYQSVFQEFTSQSSNNNGTSQLLPRKYAAIHFLNFKITNDLAVGFFEATVFNRKKQFELQYLNPLILYRTVEGLIGSPDNVLVGVNGRWNLWQRAQLYGQFLLDEFLFSAIYKPENKGWWGNKYGAQVGVKYFNALGIEHLDAQLEYNLMRPYTYSHFDSTNSYTHYNQPLAHPLGANFREAVAVLQYHPFKKWGFRLRYLHTLQGENAPDKNWGSDLLLGYTSRVGDFGNVIGQGLRYRQNLLGFDVSWMFYHNMFVDLRLLLRRKNSDDPARDLDTTLFGAGLRMNVGQMNLDF